MATALFISPIPSHPQNQGNSARIYQLCRLYQELGHSVHFVYYGMEGLSDKQHLQMSEQWDEFHFINPNRSAPKATFSDHYHVDDWYDDKITALVETLVDRYDYQFCLVNYVWMSKVLDNLPSGLHKIIDTHDVFGDRHLVAKAAGLEPTWFYTTIELESMALNRADTIFAIQSEEKAYFESITDAKVVEVGYAIPPHLLAEGENAQAGGRLAVGYIGSGNPFNVQSIEQLDASLSLISASGEVDWYLAGSICNAVGDLVNISKIGFVDNLDDFYRQMDIIVNPMVGGTGLKIKSVEALSYGVPFVGTVDAMVGIPSTSSDHQFISLADLSQRVDEIHRGELSKLKVESEQVFRDYVTQQVQNFVQVVEYINSLKNRIE